MKLSNLFSHILCATLLLGSAVNGHPARRKKPTESLPKNVQGPRKSPAPVPPKVVVVNNVAVTTNTSSAVAPPVAAIQAAAIVGTTIGSTILIIARDAASAYSAHSGLSGYGIPYQVLVVPKTGAALPALTSSATSGNFGAIVILSEVSYDYGATGFQSALTAAQWTELFTYQTSFGVRMVRIDVFPSADTGTSVIGGCCGAGLEQLISISSTAAFPTSGLKTGAGVSTLGIWHYPATITNASIATQFAQFAPTTGFPTASTAGVINNIGGRQQMVFFIGFATDWATSSNYLQHAWITWATRGLYTGYRRVNFGTQIDDMFLISDIYSPAGNTFRVRTGDLNAHKTWVSSINSRLPAGSTYFPEIAHNGNGNIEYAADVQSAQCGIGPIEYDELPDPPLEFKKPLGTGTNLWPSTPANYPYTTACVNLDPLKTWFATASNRDAFAHLSHTFTHENENNATYFDVNREITWNQAWLTQVGIAGASKFSPGGIVPPAITGLHNGDALKAWLDRGINNVVGDNTRPILMNPANEHWPLITSVAADGYAGVQITPRWATNIYYNCDLPACTVAEWVATASGSGDFNALLTLERNTNARHLLGLHHDPYMFHQANLRQTDVPSITINGNTAKYSLFQAWVETVVAEMIRLVNWPIITLKHDDIGKSFANRMARDACNPKLTYLINPTAKTITGVQVTANGNTCPKPIPVTVPGSVTSTQGFTTEKLGADPLTIWASLSGNPVTFTLSAPVAL